MVSVPLVNAYNIPPPKSILPLAMVRPEKMKLCVPPEVRLKTCEAWLPLTVSRSAPGPLIVRSWLTKSWPLVRLMVPFSPDWKLIRSGTAVLLASRTAWRSEPGPASFRLMTVKVAGARRSSRAAREKRGRDRAGALRVVRGVRVNSERIQDRAVMGNLLPGWCGLRYTGRATTAARRPGAGRCRAGGGNAW